MFPVAASEAILQTLPGSPKAGGSASSAGKSQGAANLSPFPGVSREKLLGASKAQEAGPNEVLDKAWSFYGEFLGSWMTNAPKPSASSIKAFDEFSASVKAQPLPTWITNPSGNASARIRRVTLQVEDPHFMDLCQTPETQDVMALCLVLMTEHELDRPRVAETAARDLYLLTERTPLDPGARLLFAKIALDAKDFELAWYNVRLGIFLSQHPSQSNLEFFCFVGVFAAKDQWNSIQAVVRELAESPEVAARVISKQSALFSDSAHPGYFLPKSSTENRSK